MGQEVIRAVDADEELSLSYCVDPVVDHTELDKGSLPQKLVSAAGELDPADIDIIVDFDGLSELKSHYEVSKNTRLKKYETAIKDVSIDIYVPFWSIVGLPADVVRQSGVNREGFRVPPPEVLLVTKLAAYRVRRATVKGQKDLIDIVSLLGLPEFDWTSFRRWIGQAETDVSSDLRGLIQKQTEIPELSLNKHAFAKHKKAWLKELQSS